MPLDALRPPTATDPSARAYKDWLHLNVFLPGEQAVALVNVSLHGPPHDERARAVGVGLLGRIGGDWSGGVEVAGQGEIAVDPQGVFMRTVSLATTRDGSALKAAVRRPEDGLVADLTAVPVLRPVAFDVSAPFGSGWIGWRAVPLMRLAGRLTLDGRDVPLDGAYGYHDHNWGRWFWGDDAAWEWGAFVLPGPTSVVFARACDKSHAETGPAHVFLVHGDRVYQFPAGRVELVLAERHPALERRVPGALAAIHPDRRTPDLPGRVELRAEGGSGAFELVFDAGSAAQLILAEPTRPGSGFINEIAGGCRLTARLGGATVRETGIGIFEYVE
jgi:hypothetical protein